MFYFLTSWKDSVNDSVVDMVTHEERWLIGNVLNIIRIVGTGIALIMLTWMAFSYFLTDGKSFPGSIEKKADIKGHQLMNFAIGAAIFIGASNIIYWVSNLVIEIFKSVAS